MGTNIGLEIFFFFSSVFCVRQFLLFLNVFRLYFSLPCPRIQSHPSKNYFFPIQLFNKQKKICKKKIYPCDVLSAQPSSTIDTLNCWMCIFLLLLPSLPSLVLIFVICFIWGIVSFFSRFCGNIFFVFSFIVDTFAFFSREKKKKKKS